MNTDYWRFHTARADRMDVTLYLKMLEIFCDTGEVAGRGVVWAENKPWLEYDDPLLQYLTRLMSDPATKLKVLASRMNAKIFFSTVGRFIVEFVNHRKFSVQRQWTERRQVGEAAQWNLGERCSEPDFEKAWQTLLQEIDSKHRDDGFDRQFHEHQFRDSKRAKGSPESKPSPTDDRSEKWAKMVDDWAKALDEQVRREDEGYIHRNAANIATRLDKLLDDASSYLQRNNVDQEKAVQAWKMMDGHWTTTEFERQMRLVNIQDSHPQIKELVALMGRVPNSGGRDRMGIAYERGLKIDHSSGSDIEGITVGRDLHALLPSEMAMYMDDELEDVFMYKYVRQRLQTFRYRSNMAKPVRRLSDHHASRRGPMIVCVDTSASMHGVPQRIIKSTLSLIEDMAERLRRGCYLIDFSVSVRAIDLRLRMRHEMYEKIGFKPKDTNFAHGELPFIGGGTDARAMMDLMFNLLDNDANYINADVLWMSDFLIPMPPRHYMQQLNECRKTGTRFYAMEIMPEGADKSKWSDVFDRMFRVDYRVVRRY